MTFGSLFAGIGGLDLGLERAGMEVRWQVEIDDYCRKVLAKHWPDVPRYKDVRDVGAHNLEPVDVIAGGFPCQDISYAGNGAGIHGERSGLWFEFARIVGEMEPRFVLVENVAALLDRGLGDVLGTLADLGYDAEWDGFRADWFRVPQARPRIFIVAHTPFGGSREVLHHNPLDASGDPARLHGPRGEQAYPHDENHRASAVSVLGDTERPTIPDRERSGADGGIPHRLDRHRALGNAVVPQVAEWIGRRIMEAS